ncbi:MAG TPA: phage tail tape measure protein [Geobacteraceae bacterium]|nr:phage tail tape measure protein [Geobacteraceae bacterium]
MNNYGLGILIQAKDNASATFQRVEKNFQSLSKKSDQLASRMQASTKTFFAGIGMMGAGMATLAIPASFVKSTLDTKKALGELASLGIEDLESIENAARSFSNEFAGTTTDQFITAAYDIKSGIASLSDEAVGQYTRLAALTGKATKASTEQMTSLFATAYGIYKDFYSDMSDFEFGEMFSGGLSKSVQQFKTTGQEMQAAIESLGATATTSLVPMEEQLSILGMLQATMSGSEAGTKYKAFLKSIAKAGDDLGISVMDANNKLLPLPDILDRFKAKYGETLDAVEKQQIQKAFGRFEAVAFLDLFYGKSAQVTENVNALSDAMQNGTAVTNEMAAAMNQDMGAQLQILSQQWQNLKETLGTAILPLVIPIVEKIGAVVKKFQEWASKNKPLAATIMKVVMAVGALLVVGGAILTFLGGIGMLSVGLSALPAAAGALGGVVAAIWPVIAVIAALIAAGVALYYAWKYNFAGIRDFVMPIWNQFKRGFQNLVNIVKGVIAILRGQPIGPELEKSLNAAGLMKTVKGLANFLKITWNFIKGYVTGFIEAIEPVYRGLFDALKPIVSWIVEGFKIVWNAIGKFFALFSGESKGAESGAQSFGKTVGKVFGFISTVGIRILTVVIRVLTFVLPIIGKIILFIFKAIVAIVKFGIAVGKAIGAAVVWVWNFVKAIWNGLVTAWETAGQWISSAISFITNLVSMAVQWILARWETLKQGVIFIWNAIRTAVSTAINFISQTISMVLMAIQMRWQQFKMFITMLWQGISMAVTMVVNTIQGTIMNVVAAIQLRWQQFKTAVIAVWNAISMTVSTVITAIQTRVQAVITFITTLWDGLKTAVASVWDGIVEKASGAIASLKNKLLGLFPDWLRKGLSYIGINIPAPSSEGESYAVGGYVAKTGGVSATLHEGEVITPAPAVQKIVRVADALPAGGGIPSAPAAPTSTTVTNHIHISLPNVREVDRQSIEEMADLILKKLEYLKKRKREAAFSNDFNPSLAVSV